MVSADRQPGIQRSRRARWLASRDVAVGRGLVGSLLVLMGGWVLATLPPWLRLPAMLGTLRAGHGLAALAVVVAGLVLLAAAWAELVHLSHVAPDLGLVVRATLAWVTPLLVAPPLFSRDGWAYAAQGALTAAGLSPYEHGPSALGGPLAASVDPLWRDTPAPYGPLPLSYGAALAHVTTNPLLLALGHRLAAVAGLALIAWALPRLARLTGAFPAPAAAITLASPLMIGVGVAGLHNDLLMTGLATAGLVVAAERHWAAGAVLVGLGVAVKAPALLFGVGVALLTLPPGAGTGPRLRRLTGVGLVIAATVVALGLASGLGLGWIPALRVPAAGLDRTSPLGLVPEHLRPLVQALPLVAGAVVGLRTPAGDPVRVLRALAVVLVLGGLVFSVLRLWYLLWPVPLLAVVPLPAWARRLFLVLLAVLGLVAPFTSVDDGPALAYAVLAALGVLVTVVLLVSARVRDRALTPRPVVAQAAR